jgi:Fis family transcriptional regulator
MTIQTRRKGEGRRKLNVGPPEGMKERRSGVLDRRGMLAMVTRDVVERYFQDLDGESPEDMHDLVMSQVEAVLVDTVLEYTGSNQSQAARWLGINRNTLRKKMAIYNIE